MRTIDILEYIVERPIGVVAQEIAAGLSIPGGVGPMTRAMRPVAPG